jgi:ATP-binding protein involved in chromosome partitioning
VPSRPPESPEERQVRDALAAVDEPALGLPITELGMVASVSCRGRVTTIELALVLPPEWSEAELRRRVTSALAGRAEIGRVDLTVRAMTDEELRRAGAALKGEPPPDPLRVVDAARAGAAPPRARTNPFTDSSTRVVAVASGKGGVGKSSVTTNLSIALAARGRSVAAVDADVWGFSMPRMLGITSPPALVDDVIVPPGAHGVRLVSMGFFAKEDQAIVWRGPMLHKALEQFLTDVYWASPDYLLVDMPPGTGDVSISIAQFLPRAEVIVVTTPQLAAQQVAQRAAAMAEKVDLEVLAVIENMSWFRGEDGKRYEIFGSGGGDALAGRLGVPLLGRVPLVEALREGGDIGRPVVVAEPESEAARTFVEMAERVDVELSPKRVYRSELKIT